MSYSIGMRKAHPRRGQKKPPRRKLPTGDRWEEVSSRLPLGERLPSNPEIVTEDQLARTAEAQESREPAVPSKRANQDLDEEENVFLDLAEGYEPSEEDGA